MLNRLFLLTAAFFLFGYFAQAQIVIGGGDSGCPIFTDGTCISCPSDCQLSSTGLVGTPDFVCNCNCDDGSQKKCIYSDAPAPVAEKYKEKLEEGQKKLDEGQKKLDEAQKKLEEAEQKLGIAN